MSEADKFQCQDCKGWFSIHMTEGFLKWCEDCFEKGLTKDMDDHWNNFFKEELTPKR